MCGLFAAIGPSIDPVVLKYAAQAASARGPDAYGYVHQPQDWIVFQAIRQAGKLPLTEEFTHVTGSWIVGNCRLATSGDRDRPEGAQPIAYEAQKTVVSHNGNIYDPRSVFQEFNWQPKTNCDSEAIVAAICRLPGHSAERVREVLFLLPKPYALIVFIYDTLYAARSGHPLYIQRDAETTYFSSRPFYGTTTCLIPEDTVIIAGRTGYGTYDG